MLRQNRRTSPITTPISISLFASVLASALLSALSIVPNAYAAGCNPGSGSLTLTDCFFLNPKTGSLVGHVYDNPAVLVNLLTANIFIIGGIILFFLTIYAGFLFISGGTKGQEQAKNIATTAVTGFLIMFAAYWILQIIKILTGADVGVIATQK